MNVRETVAPFARAGYAARGLIYAVIGVFAILAALGSGSKKDTKGALQTIMENTAGDILAWILIAGLVSYSLWRLLQAGLDTDDHGHGAKGLAIRGGLLASAGTYAVLAFYTFVLWRGSGSGGGGSDAASTVAAFVGSRVVAWVLAAVFLGVGIAHILKALKERYAPNFDASQETMTVVHPLAKVGLVARGLIFWVIAILSVYRGINAGEGSGKPGMSAALSFIEGLPAGPVLLAAAGLGLVAFAAYSFSEAIWRRIHF